MVLAAAVGLATVALGPWGCPRDQPAPPAGDRTAAVDPAPPDRGQAGGGRVDPHGARRERVDSRGAHRGRVDGEAADGQRVDWAADGGRIDRDAAHGGPAPGRGRPEPGAALRVRVTAAVALGARARAELAEAARRFATSLVAWLYGDRRRTGVKPVTPGVRADLGRAPPFVPRGQVGSREGAAVLVEVFLQTPRSGVLAVVIRDSRTTVRVPAGFGRRAGRWQVVHLNAH